VSPDAKARVAFIVMQATIDRLDACINPPANRERRQINGDEVVSTKVLQAIRDDLWSAWFELDGGERP
jgi:hypothetical protein